MKPLLTVLLFITSFFGLRSGNQDFFNLNELHGTSYFNAFSVCKDANGFVWGASRNEVYRYSMNGCKRYEFPMISSDVVLMRLTCRGHQLVAFTNNGLLFSYNEVADRFDYLTNIRKSTKESDAAIYSVAIQQDGSLLVSGNTGLYLYTPQKRFEKLLPHSKHQSLLHNQILYLATANGLEIYDCVKKQLVRRIPTPTSAAWEVSSLYFDSKRHHLWFGTFTNGVFVCDVTNSQWKRIPVSGLPNYPVLAIEANTDSTMMLGVDGMGIYEIDLKGKVFNHFLENLDNPGSLNGNGVYDLLLDKESHKIWVATVTGGVSFKNLQQSSVVHLQHQYGGSNSLQSNQINKIIEDKRGYVWFATNNGVSRWDRVNNQWKSFYHSKNNQTTVFLALCEDKLGRIWCGTYASGIYVIDPLSGKELIHYSTKSGYKSANDFVFDLFTDSQGDIWMGGNRGTVSCYLYKEGVFKTYEPQSVVAFAEYAPNQIFAASVKGLFLMDKKRGESRQLLSGEIVNDLVVDGTDLWLCIAGTGLLKYDIKTGEKTSITTKSGLPSNHVSGIFKHNGAIWVGTNAGLTRIQLKNLKMDVLSMPSMISMPSFSQAHCLLKSGALIWGSNQGAWMFKPNDDILKSPKVNLYINDFKVSGKSIRQIQDIHLDKPVNQMNGIELSYKYSNFSMEVISPELTKNRSRFSWKLDGYDTSWSEISEWNTVSYTNIPPGKYHLQVRLYGQSLTKPLLIRTFDVTIKPPFWKTGWFILLAVLFFGWIVYFGLNTYFKVLKQRRDEEKIRLFTRSAHELRTTLTLIKAPIQELIKGMNRTSKDHYYGSLALSQVDRLMSISTNLLDFQKLDIVGAFLNLEPVNLVGRIRQRLAMFEPLAASKNIRIQFVTNTDVYETMVDAVQMDNMLDNLISNAVKYSYENQVVDVLFEGGESAWELRVCDVGVGIKLSESKKLFKEFYRGENAVNSKISGTGIGLMLVKKYVQSHHGQIQVQTLPNGVTEFLVSIPKIAPLTVASDAMNLDFNGLENEQPDLMKDALSILIVEDHPDLRQLLSTYLGSEYEVLVADNGRIAWNLLANVKPDLVISDVMMPEMTGLDLCKNIKSTYDTAHIPVILLTALTEKTEQIAGLGLGADAYLTKPFDLDLLNGMIHSILNNRMLMRERTLNQVDEQLNESLISNPSNDEFIKKALQAVQESISDVDFGKDAFASKLHISPSLLYKKLKSLTGLSPSDFIKSVRLKYAMKLLKSGQYSVTEVGDMCGFSGLDYFGKAFKKYYGYSPSDVNKS